MIRRRRRWSTLQYRELFNTPVPRLHAVRDALVEQMEAGLRCQVAAGSQWAARCPLRQLPLPLPPAP